MNISNAPLMRMQEKEVNKMENEIENEYEITTTEERTIVKFSKEMTVRMSGSWGSGAPAKVKLNYIVRVNESTNRGSFEFYSDDMDWYAEGGLWFNKDNELSDYDGTFSLDENVMDMLEYIGYNVNEMRESMK